MFTVALLQQATVKLPNIIAHEKGFKFHAQPQTGAYSCSSNAPPFNLIFTCIFPIFPAPPHHIAQTFNPPLFQKEKGKNVFNQIVRSLLFISIPAMIFVGIFVVRPNVYGLNFQPGNCNFTGIKFDGMKDCSCGKNCRSTFPCFVVSGWYHDNATDDINKGTFHEGFTMIGEGCAFKSCDGSNYKEVQEKFDKYVTPYLNNKSIDLSALSDSAYIDLSNVTSTRDCVGYGDEFYFEGSSNLLFVILGLLPVAAFVFCVLAYLLCVSPDERFWLQHFVGFPYYIVKDKQNACSYAQYRRDRASNGHMGGAGANAAGWSGGY